MSSQQHLDLIERSNEVLKSLEDTEIARVNKILESAYRQLEKQLLAKYPKYTAESQPGLLATQRSLLLTEELKDLLPLLGADQADQIQADFEQLLQTASAEGTRLSGELMKASTDKPLQATAEVPIEAIAIAAKNSYKRLEKHGAEFADKATTAIGFGMAQGWGSQKIAGVLRTQLGVTKGRAETIARTEVMSASNQAAMQNYQANGIDLAQLISTSDDRTCPICVSRNMKVYKLKDIGVPLHPRCLPAGVVVSCPSVLAGTSRQYLGEVVCIETASGKKLTATPNHPVLTDQGWIAIDRLVEGDDVFSCLDSERVTRTIAPNHYNRPTLIEEVVASFREASGVASVSVKVSPIDFHRDGIGSEVCVVSADRLLWQQRQPHCFHHLLELPLQRRLIGDFSLLPDRLSAFLLPGQLASAGLFMRRPDLERPLFRAHLLPFQGFGFGLGASDNPRSLQDFANRGAINFQRVGQRFLGFAAPVATDNLFPDLGVLHSELFQSAGHSYFSDFSLRSQQPSFFQDATEPVGSDLEIDRAILDRFAGQIYRDRVIKTSRSVFEGHVYNVETETGWYFANDILTHNCRCFASPYLDSWRKQGLTDEAWATEYRESTIAQLDKTKQTQTAGLSPFEKLAGRLKPPAAVWVPVAAAVGAAGAAAIAAAARLRRQKHRTATRGLLPPGDPLKLPLKTPLKPLRPVQAQAIAVQLVETKPLELKPLPALPEEMPVPLLTLSALMSRGRQLAAKLGDAPSLEQMTEFRQALLRSGLSLEAAQALASRVRLDVSLVRVPVLPTFYTETLAEIHQLTAGALAGVKEFLYRNDRASSSPRLQINVGIDPKRVTIFHEMGHLFEYEYPDLLAAAQAWRQARATGAARSLNHIIGEALFEEAEIALPGPFISPYVGKIYSTGATEVLSTGLEHFISPKGMKILLQGDPEHFQFMLGVIDAMQSVSGESRQALPAEPLGADAIAKPILRPRRTIQPERSGRTIRPLLVGDEAARRSRLRETPPQTRPPAPPPESSVFIQAQQVEALRAAMVARYGEALIRKVETNMQRLIDENDLYIRAPADAIEKIINAGRFKTSFETTGKGSNYDAARAAAEERAFGISKDAPARDRPIYGFLGNREFNAIGMDQQSASRYGKVAIRMKPAVKARATITDNDTFNAEKFHPVSPPSRATQFNAASLSNVPNGTKLNSARIGILEGRLKVAATGQNPADLVDELDTPYLEMHIHRGALASEIAELIYTKGARPTPEVEAWAKKNKVKITIDTSEEDEFDFGFDDDFDEGSMKALYDDESDLTSMLDDEFDEDSATGRHTDLDGMDFDFG